MRIAMICFSRIGAETGKRLLAGLRVQGEEVSLDKKSSYLADSIEEPVSVWAGEKFTESDALIFIGACGIAVRGVAPHVASKKSDPAVLAVDECGKFAISLLSGHLGGANALAGRVAGILGAIPVITTATDLHRRFAVDVFAKANGCEILRMSAAKEISAALLAGENVGFYSEFPWEGELPEGLVLCGEDGRILDERPQDREAPGREAPDGEAPGRKASDREAPGREAPVGEAPGRKASDRKAPGREAPVGRASKRDPADENDSDPEKSLPIGVAVTIRRSCLPFAATAQVVPPAVALGMGCRRGKEFAALCRAAEDCLRLHEIYPEAVAGLYSIDLKKDEPGLWTLAKSRGIPFITYSEAELLAAPGDFTSSEFVKKTTGVDNICERSAVLGSGGGRLLQRKLAGNGVTAALALKDWRIRFDR